jgi:hypothetical protein
MDRGLPRHCQQFELAEDHSQRHNTEAARKVKENGVAYDGHDTRARLRETRERNLHCASFRFFFSSISEFSHLSHSLPSASAGFKLI